MKISISNHEAYGWKDSFDLDFESIIIHVVYKYMYSPCIYTNGKRNRENVIGHHNILIYDVDNSDSSNLISMEEMHQILIKKDINYALVPTKSHLKEGFDRFRIIVPLDNDLSNTTEDEYKILNQHFLDDLKIKKYCDSACFGSVRMYYQSDIKHEYYIVNDKQNLVLDVENITSNPLMYQKSYMTVYNDNYSDEMLFKYSETLNPNYSLENIIEDIHGCKIEKTENYGKYKKVKINGNTYLMDEDVIFDTSSNVGYNYISICNHFNHDIKQYTVREYLGINTELIENMARSLFKRCDNDTLLSKMLSSVLKQNCNLDELYIKIVSGTQGGIQVNSELISWSKFSKNFRNDMFIAYNKNKSSARSM